MPLPQYMTYPPRQIHKTSHCYKHNNLAIMSLPVVAACPVCVLHGPVGGLFSTDTLSDFDKHYFPDFLKIVVYIPLW